MTHEVATVIIIDSDQEFCTLTERLIESVGFQVRILRSARQLLRGGRPNPPACVVLEVRLPGLSGLDLQKELAGAGIEIPLIFITAHGDIPIAVQAMRAGAVDFLTKPFREQDLLDDVEQAFYRDRETCERKHQLASLQEHYELLTPCEREVMKRVSSGLLNKQTAGEMGIKEKTVKFHRGHIMSKMRAQSVVDLVKMAEQLSLFPPWIARNPSEEQNKPRDQSHSHFG